MADRIPTPTPTSVGAAVPGYGDVLATYERSLSRGRAKISDAFGLGLEVSGTGAWLTTSDGARLLNLGGYATMFHGSRHPHVEAAVIDQIRTHPIASRLLLEPQQAMAAEALLSVVPPGLTHVYFTGSGTEATEAALKLARTTGRRHLVTMGNGYHGKTFGSLSVTPNPLYQEPFEPLLAGVSVVGFGSAKALDRELAASPPAAVIVEPIQGEGGVRIPPAGYLTELRAVCDRHDALLILDEIQTGLGRVGHWWAADRESVTPDILLVGKALSGGVIPVAAMVAGAGVFEAFDRDPLIHTSTFAGAPVAMAAARASIEATVADGLVERARVLGGALLADLRGLVATICPHLVVEVRGVGLLIGIELAAPGIAGALLGHLVEAGVIVNYSLNAASVLRLTPPAVLTDGDTEFAFHAFRGAFERLAVEFPTADTIGAW